MRFLGHHALRCMPRASTRVLRGLFRPWGRRPSTRQLHQTRHWAQGWEDIAVKRHLDHSMQQAGSLIFNHHAVQ